MLTIDNKGKMCQLAKGRRALQSIVGEYDVGKSTVHDIMKSEENVLAIQKASKHSQMEEEWSLLQLSHLQKLPANHCRQCSHVYLEQQPNVPIGTMSIPNGLLLETSQKGAKNQRQATLMITSTDTCMHTIQL